MEPVFNQVSSQFKEAQEAGYARGRASTLKDVQVLVAKISRPSRQVILLAEELAKLQYELSLREPK